MAKHRVLFFVQDFGASGAEKVALNLILQLSKDSDFTCALVCTKSPGALVSLLPQNVQVYVLNQDFKVWDKVKQALGFAVLKQRILNIQKDFQASHWYLNTAGNQYLAIFAPQSVKCILHLHECQYILERQHGQDFFQAKSRLHRVVSASPLLTSLFEKAYQTPVVNLPSVLDESEFQGLEIQKHASSVPTVYSAGYVNHLKGADLFFELSNRWIDKAKFVWIGNFSNSLFSAYYQTLYEQGNYPNLMVKSNLFGPTYLKELQKASLFLFCSRDESMGMVGMEAIRLGVPVLSTPSGGPSYYINSHNGKILKSFDLEEMSGVLESMLNSMDDYPAIRVKNALTLPNFEACFAEVKSQIFD